MSVIQSSNIKYSYTKDIPVLKNVSLSIEEGEFIAFVGRNGAGKTTFAKTLNGIIRPTSGKVQLFGKDTSNMSITEIAKFVGYCYQNPDHQIFEDNIINEMSFGPKNIGMPKDKINETIEKLLDTFKLRDYVDVYPFQLSKALRQKVAVASVVAMEPKILIVDEPTTGMDRRESISIMNVIKQLNEAGHTIIVITHDVKLIKEYPRRVIAFDDGQIIADSSPECLLKDRTLLLSSHLRPLQSTRIAYYLDCELIGRDIIDDRTLTEKVLNLK